MYSYSYNLGNFDMYSAPAGVRSMIAGVGISLILIGIAALVFAIICTWKIFEKAGEKGWKCLIPIYHQYIWFKIAWETKYFWHIFLGSLVISVLAGIGASSGATVLGGLGGFLWPLFFVYVLVISIIADIKLVKRFGKDEGFAAGLMLLSMVFSAILAFGKCDYDRSRA